MAFDNELKQQVLEKLRPSIGDIWLKELKFIEEPAGTLKIPLPNVFYVDYYKKNFLALIEQTVSEVAGKNYTITFVAPPEQGRLFPDVLARQNGAGLASKDKTGYRGKESPAATSASKPAGKNDFTLNENYTFDKFVVGLCNRMAHAAAQAVAVNPGKAYNPIFIHGGVGLGKTHLLQAICHQVLAQRPDFSIYYRSGEGFVNDYITAVKNNGFEKFRQLCRSKDIMIIDDIHFLGSGEKAASQEEFFHTFNALHNNQKQIILSSDSPPKEIPLLQDRLVSRFNWGMVARLETPDFETRAAILRRKADGYKIAFPEDVINFIAEVIDTNIRDLEGALIRVIGLSRSSNQKPSVSLATEALKDIVGASSRRIKVANIIDTIAGYFNLSASDLQSKTRLKSVSLARQIGFYLTRQLKPDLSLEEIGASFGGREHSTVLLAIEKIRKRLQKDAQFRETVNLLMAEVRKKSG
ncbi:MAG: chromosomal replication initiator protein DnaA [Planctomycetes bacterium]|nr:chromosomal replication initiator protein DnaA [Planctomycetota bacterium]